MEIESPSSFAPPLRPSIVEISSAPPRVPPFDQPGDAVQGPTGAAWLDDEMGDAGVDVVVEPVELVVAQVHRAFDRVRVAADFRAPVVEDAVEPLHVGRIFAGAVPDVGVL